jgi:D-glycero-D-manno-heptose 1,7-bisphosphate phosphatase
VAVELPVKTGSGMTGAVLAGGLGTRLRSVLPDQQKVMASVGGQPFLPRILRQLAAGGAQRFVLCTGHRAEQVRTEIGEEYLGLPVLYSHEEEPLGTAGALRLAHERFGGELWLALNGDSYTGTSLWNFLDWHKRQRVDASLMATWVEDCSRSGSLEVEGGRVRAFVEKRGLAIPGWINAGIYALRGEWLASLPSRTPLSLEREVFPAMTDGRLGAFEVRAPFIDIGTPESLAAAAAFFAELGGMRRYVALDRDGTLIEEKNYLSDPAGVALLPGAAAALLLLQRHGFGVIVVTNQSGISRGYYSLDDTLRVNARMRELLGEAAPVIEAIYICPHSPEDGCDCRKPKTGLLKTAARELGFTPAECFVVGDKACDIDLGRNAGARTILVKTGYGEEHLASGEAQPDQSGNNLEEAARLIIAASAKTG